MKQRIHIFGASGSGTTTIARGVCEKTGYRHFDSDNYFWAPSDEPYTIERPRDECLRLMEHDLRSSEQWVLSGSLAGWGDVFIPLFDLAVFVYVPQDIRLDRLEKREYERYGEEALQGGARYESTRAFLEWAAAYDAGTHNGRSLAKHEKWLEAIKCHSMRITNISLDESINAVVKEIKK
jgi:adenylate kinase family enzyme